MLMTDNLVSYLRIVKSLLAAQMHTTTFVELAWVLCLAWVTGRRESERARLPSFLLPTYTPNSTHTRTAKCGPLLASTHEKGYSQVLIKVTHTQTHTRTRNTHTATRQETQCQEIAAAVTINNASQGFRETSDSQTDWSASRAHEWFDSIQVNFKNNLPCTISWSSDPIRAAVLKTPHP